MTCFWYFSIHNTCMSSLKKSAYEVGKKLPFNIFAFRVSVPLERSSELEFLIKKMHHTMRDCIKSFNSDDNYSHLYFRCCGSLKRKSIIEEVSNAGLKNFFITNSFDGIVFEKIE
jgi:hypothetical protein